MKIAVTNPFIHLLPHLKDELLADYPDTKFKPVGPKFTKEELIAFCQGCDAAIIGLDPFDDEVLTALPDLKIISLCSAGTDHIDPAALKKHGVRMNWVPGINHIAVSEMAVSCMINILRNIHTQNRILHTGEWPADRRPGTYLQGKTVGIHGCGHIGKEVVKRLKPFGVEILACDRLDFSEFYEEHGVRAVDQETLWAESEVISIHLSRNSTTIGLYSAEVLDKLRDGVYLVNTARGRMIDEKALCERLKSGKIAAAHLDVFEIEPVTEALELFTLPNFMATPHIGSGAIEAFEAMSRSGIEGLKNNYIPEPGVYPFD
ncbi:MAG: phosphoglycerate dehydrogenase [Rhodospirillaceae bacterium]